jgi:HYR domain-containing protein
VHRRRLFLLAAVVFAAGLLVSPAASDPIPPASPSVARGFDVAVEDTTPPTLDPHPDQIAIQDYAQGAHVAFSPALTAQDAVDPAPAISCDHESGTAFPFGDTPVTCTATDEAGNTSEPLVFIVRVLDGPIPEAPVIHLRPRTLANSASAHFEFSTSESVASIGCQLDEGPFVACANSQDYTDLVEGPHRFTVLVTNDIENVSQTSFDWTIDLTRPAPVTGLRARGAPSSVALRWVLPTDADFDRVRVKRRRVGAVTWRTVDELSTTSLTDKGLVNDVRYRYRVVSIDRAGNVSDREFTSARPSRVFTPQYRATVQPPVFVDWTSVRRASYYNLQVWRNGRKILSVWPLRSRYRISSSWSFKGKRYSINDGVHVVYVWPGFGPKADAKYGGLVGSTVFLGQ